MNNKPYNFNSKNPRGWRPGPLGLGCQPRGLNLIMRFIDIRSRRYYRISKHLIPCNELPENLNSILIGLMLGDLNAQKSSTKPNSNVRLRFEQGQIHKEYILHLYEIFKLYCNSSYVIRNRFDKRSNQYYETIYFYTTTSPIFN